jgi:SAM-dependent methyltransferase
MIPEHRKPALAAIRGAGIEVGALHEPFPVPAGASVTYVDTLTVEQATRLFPEIDASRITRADRILDLDVDGLSCFPDRSVDFVIISHVFEHLANPIRVVGEVFRVLRPGGIAIIAVPDKRYTFDRARSLTPLEHLIEDYRAGVTESSDEHYMDFLRGTAPEIIAGPPEHLPHHVGRARARREHSHVWTSDTFREFLLRSVEICGTPALPVYESGGEQNAFEYFGVWKRR